MVKPIPVIGLTALLAGVIPPALARAQLQNYEGPAPVSEPGSSDSDLAPKPEPVQLAGPGDQVDQTYESRSNGPKYKPGRGWSGREFVEIFHLPKTLFPGLHKIKSGDLDDQGNFVNVPDLPLVRSGGVTQPQQNQTLGTLRKFRQLKAMILYMADKPDFGKYCWYGCWCFIEGSSNLQSGYGRPRDELDSACMRFSKCYRCLAMDYKRFNENIAYRFSVNDEDKSISCDDPEGTMKRNLCECDRELAYQLRKHEQVWDVKFHEKWGDFDRRHECFVAPSNVEIDACCGKYPHRYPYSSNRGQKACCVNKVYGVEYFKCRNGVVIDM